MTLRGMPLRICGFMLRLLPLWPVCCAAQVNDSAADPLLATAAAVRSLTTRGAGEARPVRLRGQLVLITTQRTAIVLLDHGEGIYVELRQRAPADFKIGDELDVTGVSGAGDFAPVVKAQRIVRIGSGTLPAPRPTTIAELNAGGFDAAWVSLRGIVRSYAPLFPERMAVPADRAGALESSGPGGASRDRWLVMIAQGDDKLDVQINDLVAPRWLVDAEVRLQGVVFNVHNANRQFVRANLQVAGEAMIEVIVPPPLDPFALPVQPLGEVLRFSRSGFTGHRVHVRGVVTGHKDGNTLWLRDGDRGMQIASIQKGKLAPGDEVEVVGFPDHGGYTPSLSDAEFRKTKSGPAPVAQPLNDVENISRLDSNLVQIDAQLRDLRQEPEGLLLLLDWKGQEVQARMLQPPGAAGVARWEKGTLLRVVGICLAGPASSPRATGLWMAGDLQLWLRSPGDVTILRPAPWLTTRRALNLMIAVAIAMLLALVVVAAIGRRQIKQREDARKLAEVEFAAMLAERNRLAREIHDTLAQDLNAVSMQLELAKNSAKSGATEAVARFLAAAHQIVRRCLVEARESIWDMRSHILEKNDLAGALRTVAEQLCGGTDCAIRMNVRGKARRLAPNIENNLLRIGQEAVSNALKHARPRTIELEISFAASAVSLVVADDGPGFEATSESAAGEHFGLRGMRERVAQMNGVLRLGARAGGGARVEVVVDAPGLV